VAVKGWVEDARRCLDRQIVLASGFNFRVDRVLSEVDRCRYRY